MLIMGRRVTQLSHSLSLSLSHPYTRCNKQLMYEHFDINQRMDIISIYLVRNHVRKPFLFKKKKKTKTRQDRRTLIMGKKNRYGSRYCDNWKHKDKNNKKKEMPYVSTISSTSIGKELKREHWLCSQLISAEHVSPALGCTSAIIVYYSRIIKLDCSEWTGNHSVR